MCVCSDTSSSFIYGWFWLHPSSFLSSLPFFLSAWKMQMTHFKITITTSVWGESRNFSPGFLLNPFLNLNYVHLNWTFCCLLNLYWYWFLWSSLIANLKAHFVWAFSERLWIYPLQARKMSRSFLFSILSSVKLPLCNWNHQNTNSEIWQRFAWTNQLGEFVSASHFKMCIWSYFSHF